MTSPLLTTPLTRAECRTWTACQLRSCRYHIDAVERGVHRTRRRSSETCALAVADAGPHDVTEVADLLGVTRQRINQLEDLALRKLARAAAGLRRELDG